MELFTWLFLYVTPLTSSDRCFSDGIPEGERANLVSQGSSYPVGNWVNGWDAGFAAGEEKLGYNVTQKVGPNTVDAFYALAGCRTPTNVTDRGCGPDMTTRVHLSTEGWTGGYATVWDDVQTAYPATAPRNLGNMGYTGTATSYISSNHDGVTIQGNGDVHARCFDGHFWRAPVCRSNSACLLYLTGGAGWGGDELLQKATFFHMPIAWAAAKAWSDFTSIPSELNVTFFWWVPDPTFLRLAPVPIAYLLDMEDVNSIMLKKMNSDMSYFDAACEWLHANNEIWQAWLPDKTKCFERFGLYNEKEDARPAFRAPRHAAPCTIPRVIRTRTFACHVLREAIRCPVPRSRAILALWASTRMRLAAFHASVVALASTRMPRVKADLGDDYVPEVLQGYVSHPEDPLKIFECRPANLCSVGTPVAATGLIGAYYFVNTEVMTKASAFQACLMAAGIAVNAFQSLAIFGMMTVKWTPKFESASSGLSVFVLDVEILGITCVRPWRLYQTANTIGIFLQVGFSALGALALQPLMCYRHPNGQYSLLKYPDTFCGSDEHGAMLGVGIALLSVFVVGFFVYCCFGAWKVPYWSSQQQQHLVKAFLFLIGKFRLDVWWFGLFLLHGGRHGSCLARDVVVKAGQKQSTQNDTKDAGVCRLVRGLGFSLAIVLATESPQLQVAIASILTSIYLFVLTLTRPWKAPIINVGDIALCNALLLLINQAVHPNSPVDLQFADDFSAVILGVERIVVLIIAILSLMGALCLIALIFGRRFGIGENLLNLTRGAISAVFVDVLDKSSGLATRVAHSAASSLGNMRTKYYGEAVVIRSDADKTGHVEVPVVNAAATPPTSDSADTTQMNDATDASAPVPSDRSQLDAVAQDAG
eukprot:g24346.t1